MKKLLTITILSFVLIIPVISFAAYNDISLTQTDTIINVAGINLTVSGGTATLDSIEVTGDNFVAIMSGGASIQVQSSDRRTFTVTGAMGSASQGFSCNTSESILTLTNPASGAQVSLTVTPNSSTCIVGGGGGAGGGGGGGGSAPTIPSQTAAVVAATPAVPTVSPAVPATPSSAAQPSVVALTVSPAFNKNLSIGKSHSDIKRLQQLLNSDSDTKIAAKGAGSLGKETNYFGALTKQALIKFQLKYQVIKKSTDQGAGNLGPLTRAKIQEIFSKTPAKTEEAKPLAKPKTSALKPKTATLAELQKQINALLEQIKTLQGKASKIKR